MKYRKLEAKDYATTNMKGIWGGDSFCRQPSEGISQSHFAILRAPPFEAPIIFQRYGAIVGIAIAAGDLKDTLAQHQPFSRRSEWLSRLPRNRV